MIDTIIYPSKKSLSRATFLPLSPPRLDAAAAVALADAVRPSVPHFFPANHIGSIIDPARAPLADTARARALAAQVTADPLATASEADEEGR
jgi:hypothetical protein